jgi:hypothetical protein
MMFNRTIVSKPSFKKPTLNSKDKKPPNILQVITNKISPLTKNIHTIINLASRNNILCPHKITYRKWNAKSANTSSKSTNPSLRLK